VRYLGRPQEGHDLAAVEVVEAVQQLVEREKYTGLIRAQF
jgi:hypothetical protein